MNSADKMKLQDPVTALRGVGPKKAQALARMNIETVGDLIRLLPREYQDRRTVTGIAGLSELAVGTQTTIIGRVDRVVTNFYRGRKKQTLRILVSDDTGSLAILFFNAGFLKKTLKQGQTYAFYGQISRGRDGLIMVHPQFTPAEERETGILPVYPLTAGLSQKDMRSWQRQASQAYGQLEEFLPEDIIRRNRLTDPVSAISSMHFPDSRRQYLEGKFRMVFEELLLLQTGLLAARAIGGRGKGIAFSEEADEDEYIRSLPFPLTGAQKRVCREIMDDLSSDRAMNRLVQGDVGSGKTAVAEIAMFKAVKSGYQAVLMAPTEILARQHYEGISASFAEHGIRVGFLSGSRKAAEKRQTLEKLATGQIDVLVGTHAVIRPEVVFSRLGLVITDEQHRFGVDQRSRLREKGEGPNVLVMTATPIPRTLAVVIYGDLDISVIDEMPPGRMPVRTRCIGAEKRDECYRFVERQMAQGRQVYVVTPLIELSEALDVHSAEEVAEDLSGRFDRGRGGRYRVELLHGAMKQEEKDRIMEEFYRGEIDLLVSTVVIEVGINVPNATVMVIENAERFGLAQMHQLRGRVGRGKEQSYCFLIMGTETEIARERGRIMEASADGFFIAEEDLKLRGPGDIFGTRQHGLPALYISDLARHGQIMQQAREEARALIGSDPELSRPENQPLRRRVSEMFSGEFTLDL